MHPTRALNALRGLVEAYDACDSNRGAFSCTDEHDIRCPLGRVHPNYRGRSKKVCECGRTDLDNALVLARIVLNEEPSDG